MSMQAVVVLWYAMLWNRHTHIVAVYLQSQLAVLECHFLGWGKGQLTAGSVASLH